MLAGRLEPDRNNHYNLSECNGRFSSRLTLSERMDCWRADVDAADARKVEGASIWALHIPSPPSPTGNEAWNHWSSFKSTLRTFDRPALSVLSTSNNWLPLQSAVLRRKSSFGIARLFFNSANESCACNRESFKVITIMRSVTFFIDIRCISIQFAFHKRKCENSEKNFGNNTPTAPVYPWPSLNSPPMLLDYGLSYLADRGDRQTFLQRVRIALY